MRSDRHINPVARRLTTSRIAIPPGHGQPLAIHAQTRPLARLNSMFASNVHKLVQRAVRVRQMRTGHRGYAARETSATQQTSERKMRVHDMHDVLGVLGSRVLARTTAVGGLEVTVVAWEHFPADGVSGSTAGLNGGRGAAVRLAARREAPLPRG